MYNAAIKWWGGKYYYLNNILPHLPKRTTFVDVFGGAGSVVQNHQTDGRVYNDLHKGLYLFFTILKESPKELQRVLNLTLYSREEWHLADYTTIPDPITSAAAFFVQVQQSFAGNGKQWSRDKKERPRGASGYQTAITNLNVLHRIWSSIKLENLDWQECIKKYDSKKTVFYCDPPYTCQSGQQYDCTLTTEEHKKLVSYIHRHVEGFVALSGYANMIYDSYKWDKRLTWIAKENTSQGKVEEVLWIKQ